MNQAGDMAKFCEAVNTVLLPRKLALIPESVQKCFEDSGETRWEAQASSMERPGFVVTISSPDRISACCRFPLLAEIVKGQLQVRIDLDRRAA